VSVFLWPTLSILLPNGIFYGNFVVIWYISPSTRFGKYEGSRRGLYNAKIF
jgi:hypothetical protein